MLKVLLSGNFVRGFKAYVLPEDSESTETFFLGVVPESRLVELRDYSALMDEFGPKGGTQPEASDGIEPGKVLGQTGEKKAGTGDGGAKQPA